MQSLKEFYKQGNGPSSSHTMGPKKAAEMFKKEYKDADFFEVTLYVVTFSNLMHLDAAWPLFCYIFKNKRHSFSISIFRIWNLQLLYHSLRLNYL